MKRSKSILEANTEATEQSYLSNLQNNTITMFKVVAVSTDTKNKQEESIQWH